MRHQYFGKKLSRSTDERKRLFRSLARDLVLHGRIKTTLAKAKAVQPLVEHMITIAKQNTDVSKRNVYSILADRKVVNLLIQDSQVRFQKRTSGFTRIVRMGNRIGDNGDAVLLMFVDEKVITETIAPTEVAQSGTSVSKDVAPVAKPVKKARSKKV